MRTLNPMFRGALALAVGALTLVPDGAEAQARVGVEGTYLIRGGTVVVGTGAELPNTDVLIQDGMIAQVAPNLSAPGDATTIDASGLYVYAGMIDADASVGLNEIGGIPQMNADSELGEFNPHMRAVVALNVESVMFGITRATGVTSVITSPRGGLVSGQAALVNMDGWTWEDMAVRQNAGYVVNYPNIGGGRGGFGRGRGGFGGRGGGGDREQQALEQIDRLRTEITMARAYDAARNQGLEDVDLVYEAMRPLVRGEAPLIVNANSEDQITSAMDVADEMDVRIVINGGREAWKVRDQLAERGVPVVLSRMTSTPSGDLPYDAVYAQPGILVDAGVKIAFSTGDASSARHLPYEAALATAYDLSLEDAWKAVTIWPAEMFGAGEVLGTVEEGKMANVVVTTGNPLDIRSVPTHVFIKGRLVPMTDKATQLYEKYDARPMPGGGGGGGG